jgi:hypothetical protein
MPSPGDINVLTRIAPTGILEMTCWMDIGDRDTTALLRIEAESFGKSPPPEVWTNKERHGKLIPNGDLVHACSIQVTEIRHQAFSKIRSHSMKRTFQAEGRMWSSDILE